MAGYYTGLYKPYWVRLDFRTSDERDIRVCTVVTAYNGPSAAKKALGVARWMYKDDKVMQTTKPRARFVCMEKKSVKKGAEDGKVV